MEDTVAAVPPGASRNPRASLTAVTCRGGNCVAVGSYDSKTFNAEGLIEVESAGKWTAVRAPLPAHAAGSGQFVSLNDVACPATNYCIAVGTYTGPGEQGRQAEFIDGFAAHWTALRVPLPKNGELPELDYVTCASATMRTAFGSPPGQARP